MDYDLCNNISAISSTSNSQTETYEDTPSIQTEAASVRPIKKDSSVDYRQANEEQKPRAVENLFSDISCCCLPTCASDPAAIFSRTWLWFLANSDQFMSSIIVAINLIPEAISYGVMAGLGPRAALQSCWIANMATSLVGGRPGMVSGASGLMALILSRLVQMGVDDGEGGMVSGITFVPYAIGFAGILQSISSLFGMGRLANHLSAPVVVGMVNAMALLTLALQCRYAKEYAWNDEMLAEKASSGHSAAEIEWNIALFQYFGEGFAWITPYLNLGIYSAEVGLSLIICTLLPSVYPGPLFSILVVVAFEFGIARQLGVETPLIRDYGGAQVVNPLESIFSDEMYSSRLPSLTSLDSWKYIGGYGCALFATAFTETAISLNVVDRLDESQGPGAMVLIGQGFSNIVSAVMGGMGSSGVVTSSVLADRTFGTTCLSTFFTGFITFVCIYWAFPVIDYIPLSAISGISISMVCSFIQWRSIVAIFTTCLPNSTRETLPPQFNVARSDVFFMLFVTLLCLLFDIATLAIFLIAIFVFLWGVCRSCCCDKTGKYATQKNQNTDSSRHSRNSMRDEEDGSIFDQGIEVTSSQFLELADEKTNSFLENVEDVIFPVKTSDT